jgi:endoglucanase
LSRLAFVYFLLLIRIKGSVKDGNVSNIAEGYTLAGEALNKDKNNTAFIAPLGVSAMVDASNQVWLNTIWNRLATNTASQGYYPDTIALLCMMVMSGNWWQP